MRVEIVEGKGQCWGNGEHPIVTVVVLCCEGGDAALPKLLWIILFLINAGLWNETYSHQWHSIVIFNMQMQFLLCDAQLNTGSYGIAFFYPLEHTTTLYSVTRSSAIAEGPHDAPCQS